MGNEVTYYAKKQCTGSHDSRDQYRRQRLYVQCAPTGQN